MQYYSLPLDGFPFPCFLCVRQWVISQFHSIELMTCIWWRNESLCIYLWGCVKQFFPQKALRIRDGPLCITCVWAGVDTVWNSCMFMCVCAHVCVFRPVVSAALSLLSAAGLCWCVFCGCWWMLMQPCWSVGSQSCLCSTSTDCLTFSTSPAPALSTRYCTHGLGTYL